MKPATVSHKVPRKAVLIFILQELFLLRKQLRNWFGNLLSNKRKGLFWTRIPTCSDHLYCVAHALSNFIRDAFSEGVISEACL